MKTRTTRIVPGLALCAAMAMIVPEVQAQRPAFAVRHQAPDGQQSPNGHQPANRQTTHHPSQNLTNLPTGPILPMTNPIAPMTSAPVQPFIRYGGTPTVVIPDTRRDNSPSRDGHDGRDADDRRGNRRDRPVVLGGVYIVDPFYYQPQPSMPTIPGQLPGVYHPNPAQIVADPGIPPQRTVTPAPESPLVYHSEPNVIITPPAPPLTVEPPPIGMLREDVLARYGRPWGTISTRGSETFYFERGLVVVIQDGRVAQVK